MDTYLNHAYGQLPDFYEQVTAAEMEKENRNINSFTQAIKIREGTRRLKPADDMEESNGAMFAQTQTHGNGLEHSAFQILQPASPSPREMSARPAFILHPFAPASNQGNLALPTAFLIVLTQLPYSDSMFSRVLVVYGAGTEDNDTISRWGFGEGV